MIVADLGWLRVADGELSNQQQVSDPITKEQ